MDNQAANAAIEEGIALLRKASKIFREAECPKTTARVRLALSSALGAARSASHRKYRDERNAKRFKSSKEPDECEECGMAEDFDYVAADKAWRCTTCGHMQMVEVSK